MDATIISRVSQIILENRLGFKLPRHDKVQESGSDTVQISSAANEANQIANSLVDAFQKRAVEVYGER